MSLDDDCLLISLVFFFSLSLSLFHDANDTRPLLRTGRTNGWTDGWMDGWIGLFYKYHLLTKGE